MNPPWQADVDLPPSRAIDLVRNQFPEAVEDALEPIGEGFDNVAYLTDRGYVFRFPRRAEAVGYLQNEIDFLPALARQLRLPLPVPLFAGHPTPDYPYPFAGYRHLPGQTACRADLNPAQVAPALGRFLAELHALPPDETAPSDQLKRADMTHRLDKATKIDTPEARAALPLMRQLATAPPARRHSWLHGDLYPRHVLISPEGDLASLLDWGDLHVGDPALDLSIAYTLFAPADRPAFWAAYGSADRATQDHAQFRALYYAIILADYGRAVNDLPLIRVSERTLEFAGL